VKKAARIYHDDHASFCRPGTSRRLAGLNRPAKRARYDTAVSEGLEPQLAHRLDHGRLASSNAS
jgi:hypothetical protein